MDFLARAQMGPALGTYFINEDDGRQYQWTGTKWETTFGGDPVPDPLLAIRPWLHDDAGGPLRAVTPGGGGLGGGAWIGGSTPLGGTATDYPHPPTMPPAGTGGKLLIAFFWAQRDNGSMPGITSPAAWTTKMYTGDFTSPSKPGCGAGPPQNQSFGILVRKVSPGENGTHVLDMTSPNPGNVGFIVLELAGVDNTLANVQVVGQVNNQVYAEGSIISVAGNAGSTPSILFGGIGYGRVDYDGGWCNPGGGYGFQVCHTQTGIELVNDSDTMACGAAPPWCWMARTNVGTGTLSVSGYENTFGVGGGYACGCAVGKGGILIAVPGTFSIVQQARAANANGFTAVCNLPSPP
jgi:hypothetical protein